MPYRITYCNKAYGPRWLKNMRRQAPHNFQILQAIVEEIEIKDGKDISKPDLYARRPEVAELIGRLGFDPVPSGQNKKQMLSNNGNGIRHAKFAKSKSIAVIWEKIGDLIYVTFDDHAPYPYHRAIWHLREIRLGKPALPKHPRTMGKHRRNIRKSKKVKYLRRFKGIRLSDRFY